MKIVRFATTNSGKLTSLRRTLAPRGIRVLSANVELLEPQVDDLRAITETKMWDASRKLGDETPIVVQDTGFYIPSWGGFPGTFVKFALATMGIEGILTLGAVRDRDCEFRECLGYFDPGGKPQFFEATVRGRLSTEPRGRVDHDAWSELLLVFIPEGEDKTLAEMTPEELAAWRRTRSDNSMMQFAKWLVPEPVAA